MRKAVSWLSQCPSYRAYCAQVSRASSSPVSSTLTEASSYRTISIVKSTKEIYNSSSPTESGSDSTSSQPLTRKALLERARVEFNIQSDEDWYRLNAKKLVSIGGKAILSTWTIPELLTEAFPEREWPLWCFESVPDRFWDQRENRRSYVIWLQKKQGHKRISDSYKLTFKDFEENKGAWLLHKYYNSSPAIALRDTFPEIAWKPWLFHTLPANSWKSPDFKSEYIDSLGLQSAVNRFEDIYRWTSSLFEENRGTGLLAASKSYHAIISSNYTNYNWETWKFPSIPKDYWRSKETLATFLDALGPSFHARQFQDWAAVNVSKLMKSNEGGGLFSKYMNSPWQILIEAYPEFSWRPHELANAPRDFWLKNQRSARDFFAYLESQLKVSEADDWYRISLDQVKRLGAGPLVSAYGGLVKLLASFYPDVKWDKVKLRKKYKRASQRWLKVQLLELISDKKTEILEEYQSSALRYKHSSASMLELDLYLPEFQIGLEYQGAQHYHDIMQFGISQLYKARDEEKKAICQEEGITLVVVPYWWDEKLESLAATLHRVRPDVFPSSLGGTPIPDSPPV